MGGKNKPSNRVAKAPVSPAPVVETPVLATSPATVNSDDSKAAIIRRISAEMGNETEPRKIVARLKEQGVPWCQTDKDCDYIVRYAWNLFNQGKKSRRADMDLDTILARLEQVRGFVQTVGNKDKLLAMIEATRTVEAMAEQVGGLDNLLKFANKV